MWHASIAVLDFVARRTLATEELDSETLLCLIRTSKALLAGVGRFPSSVEMHPLAIHYRRGLTDDELARLPSAWRAIRAIHQAGRGIVLEENT